MRSHILVVGGLAAGPAAAAKAKRTNADAEVLLFEQGAHVSYGICEIPYFISGVVPHRSDIENFTPQQLERTRGIKVKALHRVEEIHPPRKIAVVRDVWKDRLHEFKFSKLILATGSTPKRFGLPGEEARNVFFIKKLDEADALKKFIEQEKPRKAAIVGGGYVGVEMAEALTALGIKTTVIHRSALPLSSMENSARTFVYDEMIRHGVAFEPNQSVTRFETDASGRVVKLLTTRSSFETDLVVISIGVTPNIELARKTKLRLGLHDGVLTDQHQKTSIDSIYAAGDCCEIKNLVNNKWMYIPLATYAARQGTVAGANAAGGSAVFKGGIRSIAVKVFEGEVAQVGLSSAEAEGSGFNPLVEEISSHTKIAFYPGAERISISIIFDKKTNRLLGANVWGGPGSVARANVLATAIQQELSLDEVAGLDLLYAPQFSPLWDPILSAVKHARKQ